MRRESKAVGDGSSVWAPAHRLSVLNHLTRIHHVDDDVAGIYDHPIVHVSPLYCGVNA